MSQRSDSKQPSPPVGLQRQSRVTTLSSKRGGKLTELDRELIRTEQTYSAMSTEAKWNRKTIKLAFKFMSFESAQVNIGSVMVDSNEDARDNSVIGQLMI